MFAIWKFSENGVRCGDFSPKYATFQKSRIVLSPECAAHSGDNSTALLITGSTRFIPLDGPRQKKKVGHHTHRKYSDFLSPPTQIELGQLRWATHAHFGSTFRYNIFIQHFSLKFLRVIGHPSKYRSKKK